MPSESDDIDLIRSVLGAKPAPDAHASVSPKEKQEAFDIEVFLTSIKEQFGDSKIEFLGDEKKAILLRHQYKPKDQKGKLQFQFSTQHLEQSLTDSDRIYKLETALDDFSRIAFIDTETIGLAGGSGTLAFLVGIGWWDRGTETFVLEQVLLRDFDGEPFLIDWLEERLQSMTHLCTYNGKSFDVPLLKSRCVMNGVRSKALDYPHIDLLHFSRRLWKGVLPKVSLTSVEENILELKRSLDLPSGEIPEVWNTFSRKESHEKMPEVIAHHAQDILSLARILQVHLETVRQPEKIEELKTLEALEKWIRQQKDKDRADQLRTIIADKRKANDPARGLFEEAEIAKEQGDQKLAFQLFSQCLEENSAPWNLKASLEISVYYRETNDLILARRTLEEALRQREIEDDLRSMLGQDLPEDPHEHLIQKIKDQLLHLRSKNPDFFSQD